MRLFEDHDIFAPGRVLWDNLDDVDPTRPLYEQESLVGYEDVLTVEYPNDVRLDISYVRRLHPDARFVVAIVPRGAEWKPAVEHDCFSFDDLKRVVVELIPAARDWTE